MNNDQVKLWYYLKDNQKQTFDIVKRNLSKQVIHAYDSQVKIVASPDDIEKIDRSIQTEFVSQKDTLSLTEDSHESQLNYDEFAFPKNILNESNELLAYYLLIFPAQLSKKLEGMFSKQKKQAVMKALDELRPHRLPDSNIQDLIHFICDHSDTGPTKFDSQEKVRVLEQLIDESDFSESSLSSYILNPKNDFFLFSANDQLTILNRLIEARALLPFLVFLLPKDQKAYLAVLSKRQQTLLLDQVRTFNKSNYDYQFVRNKVIEVIRLLQQENHIDSAVKHYTHD